MSASLLTTIRLIVSHFEMGKTSNRSQIDEIKERLNVEDVVGRYVKLKPVGRNLFGLCPFHKEDTPSFSVNPDLNIFKCFGCGESGDIFAFIQKIENLEFPEALNQLAEEAGVKLKYDKKDPEKTRQTKKVREINELAAKFFAYILNEHKSGEKCRNYIKQRKITPKAVKEFHLGYAPRSRKSLINFAKKKNFTEEDLLDAGLATKTNGEIRDKFIDRIMFPVLSPSGKIVAFSGRVLEKTKKRPKYLNSPETIIFKKSKNLFGLSQAKRAIRERKFVILVEGQTDVISSWQAGVENIVAPLGTGIGRDQLELLKKWTKEIAIAFDNDEAGISASKRIATIGYTLGFNITSIQIPHGNDADETIRHDPKLWTKATETRIPSITFFTNLILRDLEDNSLQAKQEIVDEIFPILSNISDPLVKEHHLKEISEILKTSVSTLQKYLQKPEKFRNSKFNIQDENKPKKDIINIEEYFLGLILQYSNIYPDIREKIETKIFKNEDVKSILEKFEREDIPLKPEHIVEKYSETEKVVFKRALMRPIWTEEPKLSVIEEEAKETLVLIHKKHLKTEIRNLKSELETAEKQRETSKAGKILDKIQKKIAKLKKFDPNESQS